MRRALDLSAPVVFIALLLCVWEIAVQALHVPAYLLPAPSAIAAALEQNRTILIDSALTTLMMALWALVIASIVTCRATLSSAVAQGIRVGAWNTTEVSPRPAVRDTAPRVGASSPASSRRAVLLPQPDGPTRATISPGCSVRLNGPSVRLAP